jgi:hypothetical protein
VAGQPGNWQTPRSQTFSARRCARVAKRFVRPRLSTFPRRPTSTPWTRAEHSNRSATDRLVVVGDPDVIERACGRDVRERLLR